MKDKISILKKRLLYELYRALLVIEIVLDNINFLTFLTLENKKFLEELHAQYERCQQMLEHDTRF